jgi:hypothetical protein
MQYSGRRTPNQKPRPVAIKNFFAPLRAVPMEGAKVSDETLSSENIDKGRPPPIVLTSEAKLLSLQKDLKTVVIGDGHISSWGFRVLAQTA